MNDDWSVALLAAKDHGPDVVDYEAWAMGYLVAHLEPHVESAHAAKAPELLDVAVDTIVAELLPDSMGKLAPAVRMALYAAARATWAALEVKAVRVEADGSSLVVVVEP